MGGGPKSIGAEKLESMGFYIASWRLDEPRDVLHVPTFEALEFNQSCDPADIMCLLHPLPRSISWIWWSLGLLG